MSRKLEVLILVAALVAVGCSKPATKPDPAPTEDGAAVKKESDVNPPTEPGELAPKPTISYDETSPTGARMAWVLDVINSRAGEVSIEEIEANVDPKMLAALPAPKLQEVFTQLSAQFAPMRPVGVQSSSPDTLLLRVDTRPGAEMFVHLHVAASAPHKLDGIFFKPAPRDVSELPTDWEGVSEMLGEVAETTQVYAARLDLDGGVCNVDYIGTTARPLALGSTFKLYILATLADQIAAGERSWDDTLAIDEGKKSLPSGTMQDLPAGSEHTLEHYARLMISISDNTATDHLLALVGRENVEARVVSSGHSSPQRLKPFLSTREMFTMKLGWDAAKRDAYVAMDEAGKRAELASMAGSPLPALESAMGWDAPRHIDTIEWFASGHDLCMLHVEFAKRASEPAWARALEIMAMNDGGLGLSEDAWKYVGFKGGSEPGVGHLSYLLQRADGAWFSVTVGANDTKKAFQITPLVEAARASALIVEEK